MDYLQKNRVKISLFLFYLVIFLPYLGSVNLFDWDEINFAEAAREMVLSGNWMDVQINFEPFWEKPPLFIWLQAISMEIFGVNAFAARFPNFLIGLISLAFLFETGRRYISEKAGILACLLYTASLTPHLYFKSGIIDPLFNLFIFAAIVQLYRGGQLKSAKRFLCAGLFLGLAVMTKGPVAILIAGLTGLVFQIVSRQRFYRLSDLAALVLGTLLIPVLWFGLQVVENGWWFVREFLDYQVGLFSQPVASHGQPFYYHALVLLFLCFPLTVLVLPGLLQKSDSGFERWMKSLFWVVLILFSVVTTKIVHYSSLCYFPMALIAGTYLELASIRKWQKVLILIIALSLFAVISTLALMMGPLQFADSWLSHIRDPFVLSQLKNSADWPLSIAFLAAGIPILAFYLVLKPAVTRLATYLVLHTALTAFLFLEMTPAIESSTQNAWIEQLKTYQSRSMVHYTIGFKSYAHLFYTEIKPDDRVDSLRKTVLQEMSKKEFYDLNSEEKRAFDSRLKYKVLHESKIPLSITIKEGNLLNDEDSRVLKEVFRGNGYIVYERKSA